MSTRQKSIQVDPSENLEHLAGIRPDAKLPDIQQGGWAMQPRAHLSRLASRGGGHSAANRREWDDGVMNTHVEGCIDADAVRSHFLSSA